MHWSQTAVVYQIYPLSFKDSNGDGKGDLSGIIDRLDYIKSLGVTAVWICPFFRSPMVDFGYDVEDYKDIDPVFGDLKTFDRLVFEIKKRGLKLIIDFVGNHTSATHSWFVESRSSRNNPKRDWYVWRDGKQIDSNRQTDSDNKNGGDQRFNQTATPAAPPNNWISVFGGSAWQLDKATNQFYLHTFLKEQPDLNWHNSEVRAAMMDVIDFWVERGADGFRVDALQHFLEDENLRDENPNPNFNKDTDDAYKALVHRFSLGENAGDGAGDGGAQDNGRNNGAVKNRTNIIGAFLNEALQKHPELFIVGEVYVGLDDLVKVYNLCPNGRFMPFNFNLIGMPWRATDFKNLIDGYQSKLGAGNIPNYVFGNHDVARLKSRLGETKARLAALLQFTLPGLPFIYYGDEIGMENGVIPPNMVKDILAKIFPGIHPGRDLERTPMQWDDTPNAGWGPNEPWLPVSPNFHHINVAAEERDNGSFLWLYKRLIRLRKNFKALSLGEYVPRHSNSPSVLSFERNYQNERLIIAINFSEGIEREIVAENGVIVFSTHKHEPSYKAPKTIELLPHEGCVIKL